MTDPEGMNVEVFVPPTQRIPRTAFGPEPFTPSDNGVTRTCPAGQTTRSQERTPRDAGRKFRFAAKPCGGCPRRAECLATPTTKSRSAIENDCEAHSEAAPAKAPTPAYAKVRREHPAIARKRSELVNRHAARYRGRAKVLGPMPMTGLVVNPKRLVRRIAGARERAASVARPPDSEGAVRAELAGCG